jgi:outer membrane immunogenic protein
MKKFLLGTVGLVALGFAAPASAADIAARPYTKAPPPVVAPIYDWSGFYIGVNGGWGSSHKCWELTSEATLGIISPPFGEGCHNATGGTAGGQIGYRWQAASWVFGIEGQGNWADFRGSNTSLFFPTIQNQSRVDAFGLLTGQVGYAWNNVLLYGKGGAAVTGDRYRTFDIPTGLLLDTANDTRWGGTVGVGIEVGFAPNWSVAFEYDHLFMSRRNITFTTVGTLGTPGVFSASDRIGQDVDLATVRVNYRWGGPVIGGPGFGGPGVARY